MPSARLVITRWEETIGCQRRRETRPKGGAKCCHRGRVLELSKTVGMKGDVPPGDEDAMSNATRETPSARFEALRTGPGG